MMNLMNLMSLQRLGCEGEVVGSSGENSGSVPDFLQRFLVPLNSYDANAGKPIFYGSHHFPANILNIFPS